jgi:hypothetical protein
MAHHIGVALYPVFCSLFFSRLHIFGHPVKWICFSISLGRFRGEVFNLLAHLSFVVASSLAISALRLVRRASNL